MSAWWSPSLTGVAPGSATGVKSPFGEFVQRDPNRAIGYQNQNQEGQFQGNGAPPTTGYTQAKYNTNIAYDPSKDSIGAGRDVQNWTDGLIKEYASRGIQLDRAAVYADQWARKKRDLLAWGNAGDLAKSGVDMNGIDANAHDIGNAGWVERFKAGGYTGGAATPAATPTQPVDPRSKALDDPYRIGSFTGGYYDPANVTLLLSRAAGQGNATPDERMQAAQTLKTVGLLGADNQPRPVADWAKERNLTAWADGTPPPSTLAKPATPTPTPTRSLGAPIPGTDPVTGQPLGGSTMSVPLGAGLASGATAARQAQNPTINVPGLTAQPTMNPITPGGAWDPTHAGVIAKDPSMALAEYLLAQGIDPAVASRSEFGQFMMKNFQHLWDSYITAQGVPGAAISNPTGVVGGVQDLFKNFSQSFNGPAGNFFTQLQGQTDNALKNVSLSGLDNKDAAALISKLMSGPQAAMNPYMAKAQDNQFGDLLSQYRLADLYNPGRNKFDEFLRNSPFWQQLLGGR